MSETTVATGLVIVLLTAAFRTFALPVIVRLAEHWACMYTLALPAYLRTRRQREVSSEVYERRTAMQAEGYAPIEIAIQILGAVVYGIPDDISWALRTRRELIRAERHVISQLLELARLADSRDPGAGRHSHRVADLAIRLAKLLGLRRPDIKRIKIAALAHDLGKLGISPNILSKSDALNPEEVAAMRAHPKFSADIVWTLGAEDVAEMVLSHHESYDGSGFPSGKRGAEIPLGARILLVADAFDAITSDRPYRRGRSPHETLHMLRAHAGRQFDPEVVKVLSKVVGMH